MTPNDKTPGLLKILSSLMLQKIPSYANKIYFSLGFLSMTSFLILVISGVILALFGPNWWLLSPIGVYMRSIHLWATQAFVLFICLHALIVFLTAGYKSPRRTTWVIGVLMAVLVLFEAELGYGLRGDFSSQWRVLQASDFYNGSGLGLLINNLNYAQIFGIHIVIIPVLILVLLFLHYLLVKVQGIAKPHKPEVKYRMVQANHSVLFWRGGVLTILILILAIVFPSPLILPTSIQDIAQTDPSLMADTLVKELGHTSDTATYLDNIDPYKFDTAEIYVSEPYQKFLQTTGSANFLENFQKQDQAIQSGQLQSADDYFTNQGQISLNNSNPVIAVSSALTKMAQSGLYEAVLSQTAGPGDDRTYVSRFLADTGVLEAKAEDLKLTTDQYGMLHEERHTIPPGAWWLAPLGVLDHTVLANDANQDRDGAEFLGLMILLLLAFPYIPYLNRLPEKIGLDKFIWKDKHT